MKKMRKFFTTFLSLYLACFLVAQDNREKNVDIGGGYEENLTEATKTPYHNFRSSEDGIWDVNDSLSTIPAYDTYCGWDTRNIHVYGIDFKTLKDTTRLTLSHENCDFQIPFGGEVTSYYGPRDGRFHYGVDIDLWKGDPVASAFEGMIRISQYSPSYGHVIVVRHNNGLETLYAHLSKRKVKTGDHVQAGDVIGLGGSTGRSSGSHLHFECRYMGEPIDPKLVVDFENGELKARVLDITHATFNKPKRRYRPKSTAKPKLSRKYHTIKKGETLFSLMRRYGTHVDEICRLNGIARNGTLRIGQKVRYQ